MATNGSSSGIVPAIDMAREMPEAPAVSPEKEISGDVSFAEIMQASDNRIDFFGTVTLSAQLGEHLHSVQTVQKSKLAAAIDAAGITDAVVVVYRDNTGKKDLKRMESLGFVIQAQHMGQAQAGSSVPPKDYYFMKRTNT